LSALSFPLDVTDGTNVEREFGSITTVLDASNCVLNRDTSLRGLDPQMSQIGADENDEGDFHLRQSATSADRRAVRSRAIDDRQD